MFTTTLPSHSCSAPVHYYGLFCKLMVCSQIFFNPRGGGCRHCLASHLSSVNHQPSSTLAGNSLGRLHYISSSVHCLKYELHTDMLLHNFSINWCACYLSYQRWNWVSDNLTNLLYQRFSVNPSYRDFRVPYCDVRNHQTAAPYQFITWILGVGARRITPLGAEQDALTFSQFLNPRQFESWLTLLHQISYNSHPSPTDYCTINCPDFNFDPP